MTSACLPQHPAVAYLFLVRSCARPPTRIGLFVRRGWRVFPHSTHYVSAADLAPFSISAWRGGRFPSDGTSCFRAGMAMP
jgi:hypothetical protein